MSAVLGCIDSRAQTSDEEVTIVADSLVAGERNGQRVEQLVGHVQFRQGPLSGSADRAIRYLESKRIELIGNVHIRQDTLTLDAPTVTFDQASGIGHAEGGVRLTDRDAVLTAETGDYSMLQQTAFFHRNVLITQLRTTIRSNDLTYYRGTQTSVARGNVVAVSDSGTLRAEEVIYSKLLGEMTATTNVSLVTDSLTVLSDWLYNSQPQSTMFARGHVGVFQTDGSTVIFGDTLARFGKLNYLVVPKRPLLLMIDTVREQDTATGKLTARPDTTFLRARRMEAYQGDSSRFIATDSVRMLRGATAARSELLVYDRSREYMTLSRGPRQRMWSDSTEIASDSLFMRMKNQRIEKAYAVGHAFATEPVSELPGSGRVQQMQGETMILSVSADTLRNVFVMNNAMSIYFAVDSGKANGMNRSSGDSMRIDFKDRAVSRVSVISGTEGEYWPERFIGRRGAAFRLGAFERRQDLRPTRAEFGIPWLADPNAVYRDPRDIRGGRDTRTGAQGAPGQK